MTKDEMLALIAKGSLISSLTQSIPTAIPAIPL
jgi:hypothetical protein